MNLRREIDHVRGVEEHLIGRIKEVEDENVHLRNELGEASLQLGTKRKFAISTTILAEILNSQRSPYDRTGLGYHGKEDIINEEGFLIYKKRRRSLKAMLIYSRTPSFMTNRPPIDSKTPKLDL